MFNKAHFEQIDKFLSTHHFHLHSLIQRLAPSLHTKYNESLSRHTACTSCSDHGSQRQAGCSCRHRDSFGSRKQAFGTSYSSLSMFLRSRLTGAQGSKLGCFQLLSCLWSIWRRRRCRFLEEGCRLRRQSLGSRSIQFPWICGLLWWGRKSQFRPGKSCTRWTHQNLTDR